jgi:NADH:ubiquinone oxidoreductase subunit E
MGKDMSVAVTNINTNLTWINAKVGETTPNKKFTLLETNCLGWCHEGPAMLINDTPYSGLTTEKVHDIISEFIKK